MPASLSPAARMPPRAFGPRTRMARRLERLGELVAESRRVGDLEPATDAVRGRREQHVGPCGDDGAGVGDDAARRQLGVASIAQRRGVHDDGAAALERVDEVVRTAIARHADAEARRAGRRGTRERRDRRAASRSCSRPPRRSAGAIHQRRSASASPVVGEAHDLADHEDGGGGARRRLRRVTMRAEVGDGGALVRADSRAR